jgi:hypothetical protein
MHRVLLVGGTCLVALGLQACSQGRAGANRGLCYDFRAKPAAAATPATAAPATAGAAVNAPLQAANPDLSAPVDDCLRRWAFSLAPSTDGADMVANAAVGACTGALARWNEQSLAQMNGPAQAPSITTGEPTNPLASHATWARNRALLYVVAARAGRCAPPPAKNGVPLGTSL